MCSNGCLAIETSIKNLMDIINRLWNVCCQMEVGAFLTCGSGIKVVNVGIIFNIILFHCLKLMASPCLHR